MDLHPGECIRLSGDAAADGPPDQLYQVIGLDDHADRLWLRRWPLARHGSPVFELALSQVRSDAHRCLPHPPSANHCRP
jgi:hypothetical protein